jgi:uncharacterized protein (DUF433 family)
MSPLVSEILQQIDRLTRDEQAQILHHLSHPSNAVQNIEKTPGVVGGDACITGTRIPVWEIIQYRQMGASNYKILEVYPQLTEIDLQTAWEYNEHFPEEITTAIAANEAA